MTTPRATARRTSLEKHREEVIALLLTGWKPEEIATKYRVNPSSLTKFQRRHADKLSSLRAEVERRVEDAAIASKVRRILDADADYHLLGDVITARQKDERYDEPGYSTGLMAHSLKAIGGGDNMSIVDEFKVDTAMVAERRALRRSVAEELAQLPRPDINIQQNIVLIRQVIGVDDSIALG